MYNLIKYLLSGWLAAGLLCPAEAQAQLNIPPGEVVFVLEWNEVSNSDVIFSGIPEGYDITNGTYLGWCIEMNAGFELGVPNTGMLVDPGSLPSDMGIQEIIYILNHKQGGRGDVQLAIWFFTDDNLDLTPSALAMVEEALAFGANFVPGPGQVTGVILLPTSEGFQNMIIEVPVPDNPPAPECDEFITGGGWIIGTPSGKKANFGIQGGIRKGAFWGGLNYIDHGTGMHVKSREVTGYSVLSEVGRRIEYNVTIDGQAGTAVVIVHDNGEPGRHDVFEIELSNGYSAGGELGGPRPGGGNLQLHKSKCGETGKKGKAGKK